MRQVLVTGGGTGIGRAIAHAFAEQGDAVTIAGRRLDPLQEAARGSDIQIKQVDVTDEAQVIALFERPYNVVVANAGSGKATKLVDTELSDWQATLDVNLTGAFLTLREGLRRMTSGDRLIAIASTASLQGGSNLSSYAASKHGVLGLVRSVAIEVAKSGITCNAICPGFVDTEMADNAVANVMDKFEVTQSKALKMIVANNPMARLITPEEVAATAVFLASKGASSINGHALAVSGGEI